ncbi:hypothetical protein [Pseudomonas sp. RW405]|uniref:hypothetical protein n=1 Tax=Pseudomonas sp. RW405 TaxID=2202652 RepID=UPI000D73E425|nr:hypothetical protein [Pseudomonas sp. RW405]PWY39048.1 hypothetical protein DK184_25015 [Pseudomonas sp. RW405]
MSQAKERPILFSGPMVRAILDGRKTVTRRALKIQPCTPGDIGSYGRGQPFIRHPDPTKRNPECPYGRPGDRLWVRETCFINDYREAKVPVDERASVDVVYRADSLPDWEGEESLITWRPSIHMPRWASRILLEVTDVRVEQLQAISIGQICKEGLARSIYEFIPVTTAFDAFAEVWDSINGHGAWEANPWVWAVEFKQVQP